MIIDTLYWREPLWLFTLILPGLIILFTYYYQKKQWQQMADPDLLPWVQDKSHSSRQTISQFLLAIAWLFFSIALAGPRTPQWIPPALQNDDVSVMAVIDFSSSMKAIDTKTDRISQAQTLLKHWLEEISEQLIPLKLRMGLIIYSGHSHTLLIPSSDKALVKHYIAQLHQFKPPTLGNDLSTSLQTASELLKDFKGKRSILLLSDGDLGEKAGDAAQKAASRIKAEGLMSLSVIGVGKNEAVRIPGAEGSALTDNGKVVVSRRQISWLKNLAEEADGKYYNAESAGKLNLADVLDLPKPRIDPRFSHQIIWDEWFYIPLLAGIFLSLLALQLSGKRAHKLSAIALIFFLSGCNISNDTSNDYNKDETNKKIYNTLISGDYARVLGLIEDLSKVDNSYNNSNNNTIRFSEGVACYRLKDYVCAQQAFSSIAWSATDKKRRGMAVFNLANTHFRLGDYEQAGILFKDAERLGVTAEKTRINQAFADSLADAVRRRLADIAKTKQRAEWLSSARTLPDGFDERMAIGVYLPQTKKNKTIFSGLSVSEQNSLVKSGIKRIRTTSKIKSSDASEFWVSSKQKHLPQQTSGLFNQLMSFETGLHYVPDEAIQVEGQRSW